MPLTMYEVDIQKIVYVMAESRRDAEREAASAADIDWFDCTAEPARGPISLDWQNEQPINAPSGDHRTCAEIAEQMAQEAKARAEYAAHPKLDLAL